jgi:hypothetical protein
MRPLQWRREVLNMQRHRAHDNKCAQRPMTPPPTPVATLPVRCACGALLTAVARLSAEAGTWRLSCPTCHYSATVQVPAC